MATSLVNQYISASFDKVVQISGSQLADGAGALISSLDVTASNATQAVSSSFATTASYALYAVSASYEIIEEVSSSYAQTASYADYAVSGSHSEFADLAANASFADTSTSASYALTASYAINVPTIDTGSLLVTASISDATLTFTKGDTTTFNVTVDNVANATSASHAVNADNSISASHSVSALSSSYSNTSTSASHALAADTSISSSYASNASTADLATNATSASYASSADSSNTSISASHAVASDTSISSSYASNASTADSATSTISASYASEANEILKVAVSNDQTYHLGFVGTSVGDDKLYWDIGALSFNPLTNTLFNLNMVGNVTGNLTGTASYATNAGTAGSTTSASYSSNSSTSDLALTANTASFVTEAVVAKTNQNNTFSGTQTFNTINADSASIGHINYVTGSATIIGDAFIVLNTDSPALRYAGVQVIDSGSLGVTASLQWDSTKDIWMQVEADGTSAGFLTGMSGSLGVEAFPTANKIVKGGGQHQITDSNISDDGTTIILGSNAEITGSLGVSAGITANVTGNLTGNASTATSASHAVNADTSISSSYAATSGDAGSWNGLYVGDAKITGSLVISGSSNPFNTKFADVTVGNETEIFSYENVVDAKGSPYTVARTYYGNYSNFGNAYDHVLATEFYDSFSYNYGSEWNVGPRALQGFLDLSGSQAGNTGNIRLREYGTTGTTEMLLSAYTASFFGTGNAYIGSSGDVFHTSVNENHALSGNLFINASAATLTTSGYTTITSSDIILNTTFGVRLTGSLNVSAGITGSLNGNADTATSSSHALNADVAISSSFASNALTADSATSSSYALSASYAANAGDVSGTAELGSVTTITFDNAIGTVYGDASIPATFTTGSLSATGYKLGASALIYHQAAVEPLFTGGTIDKKVGSYDVDALNIITFVATGDGTYFQSIAGADVTGIITNSTDTYTSTEKVQHIVTCTEAEYAAIGTPDANTFYIVTA